MKTTLEKQQFIKKLLIRTAFVDHKKKPGAVIEKLSEKDREICKELTPEDFNHRI
jgi:hypothetical protein